MSEQRKKSNFTIRAEEELLDKIGYIAKHELRSKNKEIERLIKRRIREFEKEHGAIEL